MKSKLFTSLILCSVLFVSSCKKDIEGCKDSSAINYNSEATINDNSCLYDTDGDGIYDSEEILGCTDSLACNFIIEATEDNNNCNYPDYGFDCNGFVTIEIGSAFQGGILFYVDSSGKHGLISAIDDFGDRKWGCVSVEIATDVDLGTGFQNTFKILEECSETPIAASEAVYYEINEYSDWYLPSFDELKEMYFSIGVGSQLGNVGNFAQNQDCRYWSSSAYDNDFAWVLNFTDLDSFGGYKSNYYNVRFIRSF